MVVRNNRQRNGIKLKLNENREKMTNDRVVDRCYGWKFSKNAIAKNVRTIKGENDRGAKMSRKLAKRFGVLRFDRVKYKSRILFVDDFEWPDEESRIL